MTDLKIRRIDKTDLDTLAEIYTKVYSSDVFDVGERWTKRTAYELLFYWLKRNSELAFLVEDEKKIIAAFFIDVKPWWDGNHLVDGELFVLPEYQKKGIGSKLMKHMLDYAVNMHNVVKCDTYTVKGKYPLKWYESLGFTEIKEWSMISVDIKEIMGNLEGK